MLTELQKQTAQAIVNIFETGHPQGEYGQVTLLPNDPGHLTYGRSQTTLGSGNLYLLIKDYTEAPGAEFATKLGNYLERLKDRDFSLDHDRKFRSLLREAGNDPVMQAVQDQFFDRVYWNPSTHSASVLGVTTALGVAVVYDSRIHGSWPRMRDRTNSRHGLTKDIGQNTWIEHYVNVRREWLGNHSNSLLRKTIYRMEVFRNLIHETNWDLRLPFFVRGTRLDADSLAGSPLRVSAQDVEERLLFLQNPFMRGDDVQAVQQALGNEGFSISLDGIFGPATEMAVTQFQRQKGLKSDGIVGPATRLALGL